MPCTCDKCGSKDAHPDWDGEILCGFHRAEKELRDEIRQYQAKREWVKSIWLKDLQERRKRIAELRAFLKDNAPE